MRLATDALLSFSEVLLLVVLRLCLIVAVASMPYGFTSTALKLFGEFTVPGWASIVPVVAFIGGIQLVVVGAIGAYAARVFQGLRTGLSTWCVIHTVSSKPSRTEPGRHYGTVARGTFKR
jgi:hypothetical protein